MLDHVTHICWTKAEQIELAYQANGQRYTLLTPLLRERLAEAQNWRCCYCPVRMMGNGSDDDAPTFEHIVQRCNGGTEDLDNIAIACRRCNNVRKNASNETYHWQQPERRRDRLRRGNG